MSEEDGMKVAELEGEFAEMDGYTAESRAGELLLGLGIPLERHFGPMSEVAPGDRRGLFMETSGAGAVINQNQVPAELVCHLTNHVDAEQSPAEAGQVRT